MRKLIIGFILAVMCFGASAGWLTTLLLSATTTGARTGVNYGVISPMVPIPTKSFTAVLTGTAGATATAEVDVSNDNVNWLSLQTFSLTYAAPMVTSTNVETFAYARGNITAISGVGTSVTIISGE